MSPPTQLLSKRTTISYTVPNASIITDNTNSINVSSRTNGGLSIGAKASVALGALIITALILVGILLLMKRAKRARKMSVGESVDDKSSPGSDTTKVDEVALSVKRDVPGPNMAEIRQGV